MRLVIILSVIAFALTTVVRACEGECIVGITNAFLSNYSHPIITMLRQMNNELLADIHPDRRYSSPPDLLMHPILLAYKANAYPRLEHAIFPSYFHGKCQQKDPHNPTGPSVNPAGCPNPDCPVVCGTPGSLVHFFPKLRYIVYNETRSHLQALATPGSKAYEAIEKNVVKDAVHGGASHRRRDLASTMGGTMLPRIRRREQAAKDKLRAMMRQVSSRLEKVCGGTGTGNLHGLQKCSWETRMKEYILSFP